MSLTLQSVQLQFVSIIRNLSSHPTLLSQFSIWLDLRIAEFKTKGVISLDCPGESPTPSWLNGYESPINKILDSVSSPPNEISKTTSKLNRKRHYPMNSQTENTELVTVDKVARLLPRDRITSPGEATLLKDRFTSPENLDGERLFPKDRVISLTDEVISPGFDLEKSKEEETVVYVNQTLDQQMSSFTKSPSEDTGQSSGGSVTEYTSLRTDRRDTEDGDTSRNLQGGGTELYPVSFPERLSNNVIRSRLVGHHNKPQNAIVNMVGAVGTLERWLWNKYTENRNIENMPPEDLDNYLAEFFQILQKPNGSAYSADSMSNFRCSLERFLKEQSYPCSITKSIEFAHSRQVFTDRRRLLASARFQMEKKSIEEEWTVKR